MGTFGFAEKAVTKLASVGAKAKNPTESEKKEDQDKKGKVAKEDENEKLVEVTIEKAGEESVTDTGSSGGNSAPVSPIHARNAVHMFLILANNVNVE